MKSNCFFIVMFLAVVLTRGSTAQTVTSYEFDTLNWVLPEKYQLVEFEGKQALLLEKTGDENPGDAYAYLKENVFSDGIIEFDFYSPRNDAAFIGFVFRLNRYNDEDRYELFYFRPIQSNTLGAVQYIPVNNGAAHFQYYSDGVFQSVGNIPYNQWNHVSAEIAGPRAIVYVNGKVVMTVKNLGRGLSKGTIGVWKDGTTPKCYYANFKVTNQEEM